MKKAGRESPLSLFGQCKVHGLYVQRSSFTKFTAQHFEIETRAHLYWILLVLKEFLQQIQLFSSRIHQLLKSEE